VSPSDGEHGSDAEQLLSALRRRGWTIGVAESLTGGLVVESLVAVPGASASVRGGIVAYATPLKASLLGVEAGLLQEHGAVHADVARQMAEGVRAALAVAGQEADVGVSTTGVAGPDSPDGQPVGTVFIGIATPLGCHVEQLRLAGTRDAIRHEAARRAIALAVRTI
jgi:nicotinamide-nucleotide amidase